MSTGPASTGAAAAPEVRPVVLFVDDEKGVTDGFRANMRRQPFSVVTANSAAEALEILGERHIDVVVSDEQMPGMHGSALLAEVRRTWPDVMRIILTGQASLDATIAAAKKVFAQL